MSEKWFYKKDWKTNLVDLFLLALHMALRSTRNTCLVLARAWLWALLCQAGSCLHSVTHFVSQRVPWFIRCQSSYRHHSPTRFNLSRISLTARFTAIPARPVFILQAENDEKVNWQLWVCTWAYWMTGRTKWKDRISLDEQVFKTDYFSAIITKSFEMPLLASPYLQLTSWELLEEILKMKLVLQILLHVVKTSKFWESKRDKNAKTSLNFYVNF